jgi:hyperosmotically inducible protein
MLRALRCKLAIFTAIVLAALLCAAGSSFGGQVPSKKGADKAAAKPEEHSLAHDVRHQLQVLPYYSVFDYITFSLDGGKVTLSGEVVRLTLRADAEAALRSIEGVISVTNRIEVLPNTPADDELRRGVYRAIYEDSVLQRYAISELPAIHILVKEGEVTLEGGVASEGEKNLAGARAKGVSGVVGVKNNLAVRAKNAPAN